MATKKAKSSLRVRDIKSRKDVKGGGKAKFNFGHRHWPNAKHKGEM